MQVQIADGSVFWQGYFVAEMGSGAKWHGLTPQPHASRGEAEREALAIGRSKQRGKGASAPLITGCRIELDR